jgi:hypothetical protein
MIFGMHISQYSTLVGEKYTKVVQILKNNEYVESIPRTFYDERAIKYKKL